MANMEENAFGIDECFEMEQEGNGITRINFN
jgi:hypothetical protein